MPEQFYLLEKAIAAARAEEGGVEAKIEVTCAICECPIEPCLERRTGWKHKLPWHATDLRCGGKARPASIAEMSSKNKLVEVREKDL